jgi:predicted exporter
VNWKRLFGYGLALWALPFLISVLLFGVRESNRALFESLITVIGVTVAVAASLLYFRDRRTAGLREGLTLGFAWAAISVAIDLPIFLYVFHMALPDYAADIALTYLAFPAITAGIALATRGAFTRH